MTAKAPAVKFLCDEMLARLGRYLRAAGYDTAIGRTGTVDRVLLADAVAENRMLLTCDRAMLSRRGAAGRVMILPHGLDGSARALSERLDIDWLRAPFTRCLIDNEPLRPATPAQRAHMPERARAAGGPVRFCPICARLYWPGSHVRRMTDRLKRWQDAFASPVATRPGERRGPSGDR